MSASHVYQIGLILGTSREIFLNIIKGDVNAVSLLGGRSSTHDTEVCHWKDETQYF